MNKNLHPLVQERAAGNSDDESDKKGLPAFPRKKQHQPEQNKTDPLGRTKLGEGPQHAYKCPRQVRVEPSSDLVIGPARGLTMASCFTEFWGRKITFVTKEAVAFYPPISRESTKTNGKLGVNTSAMSAKISLSKPFGNSPCQYIHSPIHRS